MGSGLIVKSELAKFSQFIKLHFFSKVGLAVFCSENGVLMFLKKWWNDMNSENYSKCLVLSKIEKASALWSTQAYGSFFDHTDNYKNARVRWHRWNMKVHFDCISGIPRNSYHEVDTKQISYSTNTLTLVIRSLSEMHTKLSSYYNSKILFDICSSFVDLGTLIDRYTTFRYHTWWY